MPTFTQDQNEALVNLIIAARHADGTLSLSEADAATLNIDSLNWESGTGLSLFIQQATAGVRKAFSSAEAKEAFLKEACALFTETADQNTAISLIEDVLQADGLDPKESAFLDQVRSSFGG